MGAGWRPARRRLTGREQPVGLALPRPSVDGLEHPLKVHLSPGSPHASSLSSSFRLSRERVSAVKNSRLPRTTRRAQDTVPIPRLVPLVRSAGRLLPRGVPCSQVPGVGARARRPPAPSLCVTRVYPLLSVESPRGQGGAVGRCRRRPMLRRGLPARTGSLASNKALPPSAAAELPTSICVAAPFGPSAGSSIFLLNVTTSEPLFDSARGVAH